MSVDKYFATGDMEAYQKSAGYLIRMAENDFGIPLSSSRQQKIKDLCRDVFVIDDYFDSLDASLKKPAVALILDHLDKGGPLSLGAPQAEESLRNIKSVIDEVTPGHKKSFINAVKEIFACAKILSSTKRPAEFVAAREREGVATANLILSAFPELGENQKYSKFIRKLTAFGNYIDSIVDLPGDKKAGEVSAEMPASIYFRLSAKALCEVTSVVAQYPKKQSFFRYAVRFVEYMRELKAKEHADASPYTNAFPSCPEKSPERVFENQRARL